MKLITLVFALMLTTQTYALNISPGQWKTQSELKIDGKKLDIQKKIDQTLQLIPEAQREQFMQMMEKKMGASGLLSGMTGKTLCITNEMAKDPLSFVNQQKKCKSTPIKNEDNLKTYKVTCKDGAHGLLTWNIPTNKNYSGSFIGETNKKQRIEITFKGDFVSNKCKK